MRLAWLRENANRVVLCTAGVVLLILAVLIRGQQGLAIASLALGVGMFALGVVLPRVSDFSISLKGFSARLQRLEDKIDGLAIRTALANFVAAGDQLANALAIARQMVDADQRQQRDASFDRTVWQRVGDWADNAENYIRATAGLGEADAILFVSQGSRPPTTLKLPQRFDETIAFIRQRQDRLRDLTKRFE